MVVTGTYSPPVGGRFTGARVVVTGGGRGIAAARSMIAAERGGKIVNMASMGGQLGAAGHAHYAASEAAVIFVANMALFLASHDADYLTGQAFNVTGGMMMH